MDKGKMNLYDNFCKIFDDNCNKLIKKIDFLEKQVEQFPDSKIEKEMTYEAAIKYFVNEKPKDKSFESGAMLIEPHKYGYMFTQLFLNKKNEIIEGRRLVVGSLDDELKDVFGNNKLVMVN